MHRVVVRNRQIHAQQPLWRASRDERMRKGSILYETAQLSTEGHLLLSNGRDAREEPRGAGVASDPT
ncbi:hypothetical protein EYF80_056070 [Liparis tanakae]|uniref:Uncharacterized protein n=1 Tax=Liparis tanakae TaxID=230148 RepID=A0A4Z2EYD1_9TELE|nr:hypothetical protein EYF80_056070 [Liparis tanakae]